MPQVVIGAALAAGAATIAASAVVTAGAFAVFSVAAGVYFAKAFAVSIVAGYLLQELTPRPSTPGAGGTVRGNSRLEQDSVIPQRWIVGKSRVTGAMCWFRHLDERFAMVQILSAGSLDGIERVWVDGAEMEITRDTSGDAPVITPATGSRFLFRKRTGTTTYTTRERVFEGGQDGRGYYYTTVTRERPVYSDVPAIRITEYFDAEFDPDADPPVVRPATQGARVRAIAAEPVPSGTPPTQDNELAWTAEHRLEGISYVLIELEQPPYENTAEGVQGRLWNRIPNIEMLVRGIKIAFPLSADQRLPLRTPKWTENAAVIRWWWLTQRRQIPRNRIDFTEFEAARVLCDQKIDLSSHDGYSEQYPESVRRYTINGVINADDSADAVERQFDLCWNGNVVEWGGMFLFRPGANRTPRFRIDEDDIIDHPVIRPSLPTERRANEVSIILEQNSVEDYRRADFVVEDAPARGDGERLPIDLQTMSFLQHPTTAINILHQQLRAQRRSLEVDIRVAPYKRRATGSPTASDPDRDFRYTGLIPGDVVELSLPEYGIGQGERPNPNDENRQESESDVRDFRVLSSSVNPDLSVDLKLAQFPFDWFGDTIELPEVSPITVVIPRPIPSPVLSTPLNIVQHVSQDGPSTWEAVMFFEPAPYDLIVWGSSPDTNLREQQISGSFLTFILNNQGNYTFYAVHQAPDGRRSAALSFTGTAGEDISLPTPVVISGAQLGNIIQIRVQFVPNRDIVGMDVRYVRGPITGNIADLPAITEEGWNAALEMDVPTSIPRTADNPIFGSAVLPGSGTFRIFVRLVNNLGSLSPIAEIGSGYKVEVINTGTGEQESYPGWAGELRNMIVWPHGTEFAGRNALWPDRHDLNAITLREWDGLEAGGTRNVFPFGDVSGYNQPYSTTGERTVFLTEIVDFDTSRNTEVTATVRFAGVSISGGPSGPVNEADIVLIHSETNSTLTEGANDVTETTAMNGIGAVITARYVRARVHLRTTRNTTIERTGMVWRFLT